MYKNNENKLLSVIKLKRNEYKRKCNILNWNSIVYLS